MPLDARKVWRASGKKRFTQGNPRSASLLFSRSRAPHHHPPRVAKEVVERIIEMRLCPPEHLKRTPGPKALLYYLPRDERLQSGDFRLPRSTRTIWQILDAMGLIERATPLNHSPRPLQELLEEVQMDAQRDYDRRCRSNLPFEQTASPPR